MVFSSPVFLFLFLPVTLAGYFVLPYRLRNVWLLLTSLVFYAWGEPKFTVVMLISIGINYVFARAVDAWRGQPRARAILAAAVAVNIGLLGVFKYANFVVNDAGHGVEGEERDPDGQGDVRDAQARDAPRREGGVEVVARERPALFVHEFVERVLMRPSLDTCQ